MFWGCTDEAIGQPPKDESADRECANYHRGKIYVDKLERERDELEDRLHQKNLSLVHASNATRDLQSMANELREKNKRLVEAINSVIEQDQKRGYPTASEWADIVGKIKGLEACGREG
jgi:hypothetical protein